MGLPGFGEKDAKKVKDGNRLMWFTVRCCQAASKAGIPWTIENPRTSRVWKAPAIKKLAQMTLFGAEVLSPAFVHLDFCQYGEAWKKSTTLLSHGLDLSPADC
eukprot:9471164-Pyramimonas_sp.AAC.1